MRAWCRRALSYLNSAQFLYRFHAWATAFWTVMLIPSWFLWRTNLFWVVVLSWWALVATHWGAWQAVRAEVRIIRAEIAAATAHHDREHHQEQE